MHGSHSLKERLLDGPDSSVTEKTGGLDPLDCERGTTSAVPPVEMVAHRLTYIIRPSTGSIFSRPKPKTLLWDVSCRFQPGELVALMGASGAGKTTLLRVISGEAGGRVTSSAGGPFPLSPAPSPPSSPLPGAPHEGDPRSADFPLPPVTANGRPLFAFTKGTGSKSSGAGSQTQAGPKGARWLEDSNRLRVTRAWMKRVSKIVPQDDILLPTLTARQTLAYAAELTMPRATRAEKMARVSEVLAHLNLSGAADTKVGTPDQPHMRGMSGGERKRLSIGVDLLTDPSVLLLDEPTTGLDSKNAEDVVGGLQRLAREGRTVVCSIHQPSHKIMSRFDRLVLLDSGRVAFCGKVSLLGPYFDSLGVHVKAHENPIEQYVRAIQDGEWEAEGGGKEKEGKAADGWSRKVKIDFAERWRSCGVSFLEKEDPDDPTLRLLARHSPLSLDGHAVSVFSKLEGSPRGSGETAAVSEAVLGGVGGEGAARGGESNDAGALRRSSGRVAPAEAAAGGLSSPLPPHQNENAVSSSSSSAAMGRQGQPQFHPQEWSGREAAGGEVDEEVEKTRRKMETGGGASSLGGRRRLREGRASWPKQTAVLAQRAFHDELCDTKKFLGNCMTKIVLGVLVGLCWLNQGRPPTNKSIFPLTGVLFTLVNNSVMSNLFSTVLAYPSQRALVSREYRNGMFALSAYYVATIVCILVVNFVLSILMGVPVYFMVGLNEGFGRVCMFIVSLAFLCFIGSSLGLAVGSLANDFKDAQAAVLPTLVPLLLFSGYVIPYDSIPDYFKWLYYCSFFQYAFGVMRLNQFKGLVFDDCDPQTQWLTKCIRTGEEYLRSDQVNLDPDKTSEWGYIGILGAFMVGIWAIGFSLLKWKLSRKSV